MRHRRIFTCYLSCVDWGQQHSYMYFQWRQSRYRHIVTECVTGTLYTQVEQWNLHTGRTHAWYTVSHYCTFLLLTPRCRVLFSWYGNSLHYHYCVNKSPPSDSIMSHINPIHNHTVSFCTIHLYIILPSILQCVQNFGWEAWREKPLGRPRRRWEDNNEMDIAWGVQIKLVWLRIGTGGGLLRTR
jgi:hypothetical protein